MATHFSVALMTLILMSEELNWFESVRRARALVYCANQSSERASGIRNNKQQKQSDATIIRNFVPFPLSLIAQCYLLSCRSCKCLLTSGAAVAPKQTTEPETERLRLETTWSSLCL